MMIQTKCALVRALLSPRARRLDLLRRPWALRAGERAGQRAIAQPQGAEPAAGRPQGGCHAREERERRLTQADDLTPAPTPELCRDDAADAVPDHLLLVVDEDGRVVVEADVPPIGSARRVLGANDDGPAHVAAADLGRRGRGARAGAVERVGPRALDDDDDLVSCRGGAKQGVESQLVAAARRKPVEDGGGRGTNRCEPCRGRSSS